MNGVAIEVPDKTAYDPSGTGKVDKMLPPGAAIPEVNSRILRKGDRTDSRLEEKVVRGAIARKTRNETTRCQGKLE